jgi:hypothetical protein
MNLQIYIVNAPLIGYMTAISARACIIRYTINPDLYVLKVQSRLVCFVLTNDHESDEE